MHEQVFFILQGLFPQAEGGVYLAEKRTITDTTTCSQCITLTIDLPKECRLNADILESRMKDIFKKELLRDLCRGCPLENDEI
jgi:hypothetical protein